jgi:hypothetical protein
MIRVLKLVFQKYTFLTLAHEPLWNQNFHHAPRHHAPRLHAPPHRCTQYSTDRLSSVYHVPRVTPVNIDIV